MKGTIFSCINSKKCFARYFGNTTKVDGQRASVSIRILVVIHANAKLTRNYPYDAIANRQSTCDFTMSSIPCSFGLVDSMRQYSSGACARSPTPRPKCPAGSFSGASVNTDPGHDPPERGISIGSMP